MAKKQAVNGERGHWSAKAKLGIFLASVVSAVAGLALLAGGDVAEVASACATAKWPPATASATAPARAVVVNKPRRPRAC